MRGERWKVEGGRKEGCRGREVDRSERDRQLDSPGLNDPIFARSEP